MLEDDTAVGAKTEVDEATEVEETEAAGAEADSDDESTDEADADADGGETDAADTDAGEAGSDTPKRRIQWPRVVAFGLLPALALLLALGAGYLKWLDNSVRNSDVAAATSVQAAKDTTIALLSYQPDTVEQQLGAARDLLTGEFRESYTALTNDVVIPGAKEKQIAAVASVPAAASVSATPSEAVVLVFVNQTVSVGQDPPTDTASSVRVTLEKVGDRWLISKFDPV
ncbi:MAG: hypothetical protein KDB44_10175 [Mycobacterium sp.]|nr:hypothetical protein [Mycobacterium sp.]